MTRRLLTPSPSPPPPVPTPSLPTQINAATRKQHVELNRLIVDRLPLALPPNASDPTLLGLGLAAFAGIYITFEALWQELTRPTKVDAALSGTHECQVRRWLLNLRPDGLARTERMKNDLNDIMERTGVKINSKTDFQKKLEFSMTYEIREKPHMLIAYGWVMYMAIFSGGRWIRQQLSHAGVEFWVGQLNFPLVEKSDVSSYELPGFSFLSFDGEHDGEDIKALFKSRLAEAETLLTQQERQEVIQAAKMLFVSCIDLVEDLDNAVWWRQFWLKLRPFAICFVVLGMFLLYAYGKLGWAYIHGFAP